MNIYIIGMPLSGKTTIGKALAEQLKFNHIDLDDYIESTYNVSINNLFSSGNEKHFRDLEQQSLKTLLKEDNIVVSTGGGIVENLDNKRFMNGPIILLDMDMNVLKERQQQSYQRPLLKTLQLEDLYKRRKNKYYEFANKIIKGNNLKEIIKEITIFLTEEEYLWED